MIEHNIATNLDGEAIVPGHRRFSNTEAGSQVDASIDLVGLLCARILVERDGNISQDEPVFSPIISTRLSGGVTCRCRGLGTRWRVQHQQPSLLHVHHTLQKIKESKNVVV